MNNLRIILTKLFDAGVASEILEQEPKEPFFDPQQHKQDAIDEAEKLIKEMK